MNSDSRGNEYHEVEIPGGNVRVTYIQDGWAGSPSVRIQIRDESGHLRQGPEIPLSAIGGLVGAVVELLANRERLGSNYRFHATGREPGRWSLEESRPSKHGHSTVWSATQITIKAKQFAAQQFRDIRIHRRFFILGAFWVPGSLSAKIVRVVSRAQAEYRPREHGQDF